MTEPILAIVFTSHFAAIGLLPVLLWQEIWRAALENTAGAWPNASLGSPTCRARGPRLSDKQVRAEPMSHAAARRGRRA
jgi:hypothetical protein